MADSKKKIIVVKIGSSTLVDAEGRVDMGYFAQLATQIADLRSKGWSPIIVSSGAIACSLEILGLPSRPSDIPTQQACASVGMNALVTAYKEAFDPYDIITSLVLITRATTASRSSYLHARDTLLRLLDLGVVPIINENDTVAVEEIQFGDNDTLAALVSCLVKADMCVIFSDIDGFYDANPSENPDAQIIRNVERITPELMAAAGGVGSGIGSGGMVTKLRAARVLMVAGIPMVICHGREEAPLVRIISGEPVGTRFEAASKPHEITPRKLWIALGDSAKGKIIVDTGAKEALITRGSSLLAVGIAGVEGAFHSGDIVDIVDKSGLLFARGQVGASSSAIALARGRSQREILSNEIIRDLGSHPVVHRDSLVVFE